MVIVIVIIIIIIIIITDQVLCMFHSHELKVFPSPSVGQPCVSSVM